MKINGTSGDDVQIAIYGIIPFYNDDPEMAHVAEDELLWDFIEFLTKPELTEHALPYIQDLARKLLILGNTPRKKWYA